MDRGIIVFASPNGGEYEVHWTGCSSINDHKRHCIIENKDVVYVFDCRSGRYGSAEEKKSIIEEVAKEIENAQIHVLIHNGNKRSFDAQVNAINYEINGAYHQYSRAGNFPIWKVIESLRECIDFNRLWKVLDKKAPQNQIDRIRELQWKMLTPLVELSWLADMRDDSSKYQATESFIRNKMTGAAEVLIAADSQEVKELEEFFRAAKYPDLASLKSAYITCLNAANEGRTVKLEDIKKVSDIINGLMQSLGTQGGEAAMQG